jgi:ABC-2 type transport system ATP-binding protein
MSSAVRVEDLRKTYGTLVAVANVSFEVPVGEIFGVVGPNGAGKTTTIECIEGIRRPDGGSISVLGFDPARQQRVLRQRIGVQLQEAALPARIKAWEALDLYASFYDHAVEWKALLERLGLTDKRNASFSKLSGGQKQRLFIALALLNDPELIFLDELTTGLDPQARRSMWDLVRGIRDQGKTVVLTTHFMEEAERLCDRVAIMDQGRIVALDSPANLIRIHGAENRITFIAEGACESKLQALAGVARVDRDGDRVIVQGTGDGLVGEVVRALGGDGFGFRDLRTEQSSLEDVFLALTGKEIRD